MQDEIKKEGWLGVGMGQSIFKKHMRPCELSQKTGSAWILISLCGGFLFFLPSVCLVPSCVPSFTLSCSTNSLLLLFSMDHFFSFNLSRQVYIRTTPLLCFIQSVLLYYLAPHPLPWFWTLRVALLSKKLFCYHLEINPRGNICMEPGLIVDT